MKSMKTRLGLVALGIVAVSSFSLMIASNEINLKADLSNAVQNMEKVFFLKNISSNVESGVILTNSGNFVKIDTRGGGGVDKNIIIEGDGTYVNSVNDFNSKGSHILGGEGNQINGSYDTIIGGLQNKISSGDYSTIGGGNHNIITGNYNVIAGGSENKIISGNYSTVPGGKNNKINGSYSVALGVNNVVSGDYSVALGSGSKVIADRSFLWTDGNQEGELRVNDVFAIVSKSGMAINTATPHDFAKLIVSGSLVINKGNNFVCSEDTKGAIVATGTDGMVCLCSCDGSGRNSLYEGCESWCNVGKKQPKCGNIQKICNDGGKNYYSGGCINGKVIEGTGSYFVDTGNSVHRTCQSDDGNFQECSGAVSNSCGEVGEYVCDTSVIDTTNAHQVKYSSNSDIIVGWIYNDESDLNGVNYCAWLCDDGYMPKLGEDGIRRCVEKGCVAGTNYGYHFGDAQNGSWKQSSYPRTFDYGSGTKQCWGYALCDKGIFTGFVETGCVYKCNPGVVIDNNYDNYGLTKLYYPVLSMVNSGVIVGVSTGVSFSLGELSCTGQAVCNPGNHLGFTGESTCTTVSCTCPAVAIDGYNIEALSCGSTGFYYKSYTCPSGETRSCTRVATCSNGVTTLASEENCAPCNGTGECAIGSLPEDKDGVLTGSEGVGEWRYVDTGVFNGGICERTCKTGYYYGYNSAWDEYKCNVEGNNRPECGSANGGRYDDLDYNDSLLLCEEGIVGNFHRDRSEGKWVWNCVKNGISVDCGAFKNGGNCCESPVPEKSIDVFSGYEPESYAERCDKPLTMGGCFPKGGLIEYGNFCSVPRKSTCLDYEHKNRCYWEDRSLMIVGFVCEDGYHLEGCDCVKSECDVGDMPFIDDGILMGSEGVGEWHYVNPEDFDGGSCERTCESGYYYGYNSAEDEYMCNVEGSNEPKCGFVNGEEYAEVSENNTDYGLCEEGDVANFKTMGTGWTWNCVKGTSKVSCNAVNCNYKSSYGQFCDGDNGPGYEPGEWDLDTCTCRCPEGTFENEDHFCEKPQCSYHWYDVQDCENQGTIHGTWDVENCTCICPEGTHVAGGGDFHCESDDSVGMCYDDEERVSRPLSDEEIYEMTHNYNYDFSPFLSECRSYVSNIIRNSGIEHFSLNCGTDFRGTNHVYCQCTYEYECGNLDGCNVEPRGFIPSGSYRVAWKRPQARVCVSERRYCLDGRLLGSYLYSSCTNYRRR